MHLGVDVNMILMTKYVKPQLNIQKQNSLTLWNETISAGGSMFFSLSWSLYLLLKKKKKKEEGLA